MGKTTLYSKYRPNRLDDLIGQSHIKKYFQNSIKQNSLSHAFLLSGTRGVGKTTLARIIAMIVNCEDSPKTDYDIDSKICQMIINKQCPDVIEMDAASNTSIEDIRQIRDHSRSKPLMCKTKVFIIDEIHCLAKKASSALLKTLEEPPENCIFILATTEPQNLINTILSRCIRLNLHNISFEDIKKRLQYICDQEKITYDDESLSIIAKKGHGSLRDAISELEAIASECDFKLTQEAVESNIGSNGQEFWLDIFNRMLTGNKRKVLEMSSQTKSNGFSPEDVLLTLLEHAHDMYLCKCINSTTGFYIEKNIKQRWEKALQVVDINKLKIADNMLMRYAVNLKNSPRQDILLESCLMDITDKLQ